MVEKEGELRKIAQEAQVREMMVWVAVERKVEEEAEEETGEHPHELHERVVKKRVIGELQGEVVEAVFGKAAKVANEKVTTRPVVMERVVRVGEVRTRVVRVENVVERVVRVWTEMKRAVRV